MEALGAEKKLYGLALGGSWKKIKTGFSHLGAKRLPKRRPRGSKIESKRRFEFKKISIK